jgi:hypothetical protein
MAAALRPNLHQPHPRAVGSSGQAQTLSESPSPSPQNLPRVPLFAAPCAYAVMPLLGRLRCSPTGCQLNWRSISLALRCAPKPLSIGPRNNRSQAISGKAGARPGSATRHARGRRDMPGSPQHPPPVTRYRRGLVRARSVAVGPSRCGSTPAGACCPRCHRSARWRRMSAAAVRGLA